MMLCWNQTLLLSHLPDGHCETKVLPKIGADTTWVEGRRQGVTIMIKKVKGGYKVLSEKGKNLGGPYKSKAQAEKRLRQVEFFKHHK